MWKDELYTLVQLADKRFDERQNGLAIQPYQDQIQNELFVKECHRIKKAWTDLLFSQAKEDRIRRYVRYQQQALLDLTDKVYRLVADAKLVLAQLLSLNNFLIHYFNGYIDPEIKIPDLTFLGIVEQLTADSEKISSQLEHAKLDRRLKEVLLGYIDEFTTANLSPVTYRSLDYFRRFIETTARELAAGNNQNLTKDFTQALCYLNFNDSRFYRWVQDDILGQRAAIKTQDQQAFLRRILLTLKSMPVARMSYDPLFLPINQQLVNWLENYVKNEALETALTEAEQSGKLGLKLTVAQLALLLRLLYEEDVFVIKNIAALLRFFSNRFMSKKQGHISYGSMNKLYYSADQFTGYAVRELLLKMTAKINKTFFPK
jgi:hypothetical protein